MCTTCREGLSSLRSSHVTTTRAFGTASSQKRSSPIPHHRRTSNVSPLSKRAINTEHLTLHNEDDQHLSVSGFAPLPHRRLISLSGPDAAKFLQGLITNNVSAKRRTHFYSAFLDARGRVLWDVFVWIAPGEENNAWACYIEVDGSEAEALKKHLKRHKLRSKVKIEDMSELGVWAAWGIAGELEVREGKVACLLDPRGGEGDLERFLTKGVTPTDKGPKDVETYHTRRYKHGIAEGPAEIPRESALPMEYNIDLSSGIDFKKGCYVGQELTIRTKHTGVVRKRVLPVSLTLVKPAADAHPESTTPSILPGQGVDIKQLDSQGNLKKGRAAGKFIAGIGNVGLALCRLENMTPMKVSAEGGTWKEGMAFGCETQEGVVRIEPVLHEEFLEKEKELWGKKRG
jgi:folate-binding protein YgfZ